jgi:hypothetical protein
MPTMNIKDPEVHALARRMADQAGQSMTRVIHDALIEMDRRLTARSGRIDGDDLLTLAQWISTGIKGPVPDLGQMYGTGGLPL